MMFASRDYDQKWNKLEKLKEKIRKSELERRNLERKLDEIMIEQDDCKKKSLKHIKSKYEHFLRDDQRRSERNENLLRMLDRVDCQANAIATKTERLKLLKNQYELYLMRNVSTQSNIPAVTATTPFVPSPIAVAAASPIQPQTQANQQQSHHAPINTSSTPLPDEDHFKSDFVKCLVEMNRFHYGNSQLMTPANLATPPPPSTHGAHFDWPPQPVSHHPPNDIPQIIIGNTMVQPPPHKVVFDVPAKAFTPNATPIINGTPTKATTPTTPSPFMYTDALGPQLNERVPNILISLPRVDNEPLLAHPTKTFNDVTRISGNVATTEPPFQPKNADKQKEHDAAATTHFYNEAQNMPPAPSSVARSPLPINADTAAALLMPSPSSDDSLSKAFTVECNVTSKKETSATVGDASSFAITPIPGSVAYDDDKRNDGDTRDVLQHNNAQETKENVSIFESEYDKKVTGKLNNENGKQNDIVFEEHENSVMLHPPPPQAVSEHHTPGDNSFGAASNAQHLEQPHNQTTENVTRNGGVVGDSDGGGNAEALERISNKEADTAQFAQGIDNNTTSSDYDAAMSVKAFDGVDAEEMLPDDSAGNNVAGVNNTLTNNVYGNDANGIPIDGNVLYDESTVVDSQQYYQDNQGYVDTSGQQYYSEEQPNVPQYLEGQETMQNVTAEPLADQQYDGQQYPVTGEQPYYAEGTPNDQQYIEDPNSTNYIQSNDQYSTDQYQYQANYGQDGQEPQMAYSNEQQENYQADPNYNNYDPNGQQQYDPNYYQQQQGEYPENTQQDGDYQAEQYIENAPQQDMQQTTGEYQLEATQEAALVGQQPQDAQQFVANESLPQQQYDDGNTLSGDGSYPTTADTNNKNLSATYPDNGNVPSEKQYEQHEVAVTDGNNGGGGGVAGDGVVQNETRSENLNTVDPSTDAAINYLESETDDTVSQQVKISNNESDFDFSNN